MHLQLALAENDKQAFKRMGAASDLPLAALRNKLCNLLWKRLRSLTPLSLSASHIMAHAAIYVLKDTGYRYTLVLLFLLLGPIEQQQPLGQAMEV